MATQKPSATWTCQEQDVTVFQQLEDYAWDSDPEFQTGLQAILGSNPSAGQSEHLSLRARCFYFTRKTNTPIDFNAYQTWRSQRPSRANGTSVISSASDPSSTSHSALRIDSASRSSIDAAPRNIEATAPYPTSFSQLVELITSGEPIPGIKKVPDTVMEGQASEPTKAKRKKPWEKDDGGAGGELVGPAIAVAKVA